MRKRLKMECQVLLNNYYRFEANTSANITDCISHNLLPATYFSILLIRNYVKWLSKLFFDNSHTVSSLLQLHNYKILNEVVNY